MFFFHDLPVPLSRPIRHTFIMIINRLIKKKRAICTGSQSTGQQPIYRNNKLLYINRLTCKKKALGG